jgi:1-acyl-sn-glycerol-3-phosphate acyltransferase
MKYLLFPLRIVYCTYALTTFVVLMLVVMVFAFAASFFGRIKGGNFIYWMCCRWADIWFLLVGIRHKNLYEVPHDKTKQYIFVANHISYLDAPVIAKTLHQRVRALGKVEMAKVPVFGFIYRNAIVTVNRSDAANRAQSVRILKSIIKRGISIFIFPEGTFNETHQPVKGVFDGAFRIAIETQTPIKPLLFLDTYDRWHYSSLLSLNPGRSRSVFLKEVPVAGLTLHDLNQLKQQVQDIMAQKLQEYGATWIRE